MTGLALHPSYINTKPYCAYVDKLLTVHGNIEIVFIDMIMEMEQRNKSYVGLWTCFRKINITNTLHNKYVCNLNQNGFASVRKI